MKQQNIEISEQTAKWFTEHWQTGRKGMTAIVETATMALEKHPVCEMFADPGQAHAFMLDAWKHIWRRSLAEIKGLFSIEELYLIVDIHNAHMVTPQVYGGGMMVASISDSIALDGMAEKWGVNPGTIIEKAGSLTHIQALCLEMWACGFWYGSEQAGDFEKYVAFLAAEK